MSKHDLRQELVARGLPAKRYSFIVTPVFADLLWEVEGRAQYEALEPALIIESRANGRHLVVERVRDELRYYICTHRDPYDDESEHELGVVSTVDHLYELVVEFLEQEVSPGKLETPRFSNGKHMGRSST